MDELRDCHTEWSKSEKDKYHMISIIYGIKKIIAGRRGEGVGKRKINWDIGTDIYTLPYIK